MKVNMPWSHMDDYISCVKKWSPQEEGNFLIVAHIQNDEVRGDVAILNFYQDVLG